jgi:prophage DNA circulation protein
MSDYWEDSLMPASFAGVRFPSQTIGRTGGRRAVAHEYTFRDGQDLEDTGRKAYRWTIKIPLFAGMEPEDPAIPLYPDTYELLVAVFEGRQDLAEGEYVDPEHGPIQVKVVEHDWELDAMGRNGGTFTIQMEEINDAPFATAIFLLDAQATAESYATEIDGSIGEVAAAEDISAAWSDEGVPDNDLDLAAGEMFLNMVDSFFTDIDDAALAADDVAMVVDRYQSRINRVLRFSAMRDVSNWSLMASLARLADTLRLAGEAKQNSRPNIVDFVVPWVMSAKEIAFQLYGDPSRSEEIVRRNPYRRPNSYPRGRVLKVQSE